MWRASDTRNTGKARVSRARFGVRMHEAQCESAEAGTSGCDGPGALVAQCGVDGAAIGEELHRVDDAVVNHGNVASKAEECLG